MGRDVILTCAVTGSANTFGRSSFVPVTPKEIAESALEAAAAGAAVVHLHVRDPETGKPSMDLALYSEIVSHICERNGDVLINTPPDFHAMARRSNAGVDLKDNSCMRRGVPAQSNAALVEEAAGRIAIAGHRLAPPTRARSLIQATVDAA